MTETLPVDGRSLSLEQFLEVVRGRRGVSISSGAAAAVRSSRNAVERVVDAGRPVYGISTGFGALSDRTVPREKLRELQASLIRSHASGTGPALPADLVRGVMLLRLNSLARGLSGVRIEVVERLADLLNHGLVPMIPEQGSVGASGDLAPLAHLALALTGEGAFVDERTRTVLPARDVLRSEGIQPLVLAEKEGVALLNGTSLMAAYLALGVADARELLDAAMVAAAVSFDALLGAPESLDDRLGEIRNSPDHREVARALRALLHGSGLAVSHEKWTGQDPYSSPLPPPGPWGRSPGDRVRRGRGAEGARRRHGQPRRVRGGRVRERRELPRPAPRLCPGRPSARDPVHRRLLRASDRPARPPLARAGGCPRSSRPSPD